MILPFICNPKRSIGIDHDLPYILLVKDQDINKVALIAGALMIIIVVVTQWGSITSLVKSPASPENLKSPKTQAPSTPIIHTNNALPSKKLILPPDQRSFPERIASGEKLSLQFCSTCHVRPTPDALAQKNWSQILPHMAAWVGVETPEEGLLNPTGFERVLAAGIYPTKPMMSVRDWKDVVDYYVQTSPKQLPATNPQVSKNLSLFETFKPERKFDAAVMTVRVNHSKGGLWVVHEASDKIYRLDSKYKWLPKPRQLTSSPATLVPTQSGILVPLIGTFFPSFVPQGSLGLLKEDEIKPLTGILHRPTDVLPVDLNQDGREDLVVTEHGHLLGSVFWLEKTNDGYKRHALLDLPGGLNVASGNFNDDDIPDLVILTGQAREGVHLFLSASPGKFEHRMILMRQPAWGYSHIEVVDFNKDGHPDLLITNGDNGELDNFPPKPYNGVRLHLNNGENYFNEAFFFPQYGAYRAVAEDFDGDGDLDIASIAFFGKHDLSPDTGFVYLRQEKPMEFTAHTLAASRSGRWLTMDAGDIDKDGDIDIALGSYNAGPKPGGISQKFHEQWQANPIPVIILKNRTK
ncbi:MAG: VCBS repeat-containing protein [Verrucomicrobiota bacterium]|jgi:hypothetical protein|nr:VCBS repeat-containing protein [Verrucomicrobiota bacterium]